MYLFKGKAFWHSGSSTTWIYLRKKVGTGCFLRPGGENGESASCLLLFWCRPIADVVVQEEGLTLPPLVMEGEGKKNSFATRQHVLLPVFVSAYYALPACSWGWGNFKKKGKLRALREDPIFQKNINKVSQMATTMVHIGKTNTGFGKT